MFRNGETVEIVEAGVISPATIAEDRGHTVKVIVKVPMSDMRSAFPSNPPTIDREKVISRRSILAAGWDR